MHTCDCENSHETEVEGDHDVDPFLGQIFDGDEQGKQRDTAYQRES